jgi:chromosome segregation ATPase
MKEFASSLFSAQNVTNAAAGGFPFWVFWLLIFVILLLLIFIFLRDKDLRRRLDSFFLGIKNRARKVRLQANLKKEQQKHEAFMFELGSKAWEEDVEVPSASALRNQLARMDKQKSDLEDKRAGLEDKIEGVNQEMAEFQKKEEAARLKLETEMKPYLDKLEEVKLQEKDTGKRLSQKKHELDTAAKDMAAAEKEVLALKNKPDVLEEVKQFELESLEKRIKELAAQKTAADVALRDLKSQKAALDKEISTQKKSADEFQRKIRKNKDKAKDRIRRFQKDIHEWEKQRDKVSEGIEELENQKKPLFRNLGEQVDKDRVTHEELEILYHKIDRTKIKTQELEGQIKDLD